MFNCPMDVPHDISNPSALVYTPAPGEAPNNIGPGDVTSMYRANPSPLTSTSWFSVQDYGATGNGVTDDSPFILLALAAANAVPGSVLYFPPPTVSYNYNQTANGPIAITQRGSRIMGSGAGSIINLTGTTGNGLEMTNDYQSIVGINVQSATLAAGAYAICQANNGFFGTDCRIQDSFVSVTGNGNGIGNYASASTLGGLLLWDIVNINVFVNGNSAIALDLQCGTSGVYGTNFILIGNTASTSSVGLRLPTSVGQDTVVFSNFVINGFTTDIAFSPLSGVSNSDYQFSNFLIGQSPTPLRISPASGAVINRIRFNNGWIGTYGTGSCVAFQQAAGSSLYNMTFTDCRFVGGEYALYSQYTNQPIVAGPQFNGCIFENATIGAVIQDDSQYAFDGCLFYGNTYGVIIGPNSQFTPGNAKTFEACQFSANTTNLAFQSGTNTYAGKVNVRNCLGVTPMAGLTAPAVAATNVYVENPFPFDCTVYVALNGSTMSNVILKDAHGNTSSTGLKSGSYNVGFGTSIALVYSAGKPAWVWVSK